MLAPCSDEFLNGLRAVLPPATFRAPEARYAEEPRGFWTGEIGAVLAPANTAEVAVIIKAAAQARVPVIPYGGGTGLVGGQLSDALPAPVILSLERMNAIRRVDPVGNILEAEAGAILANVQAAAEEAGRLFPLSLASEGSAVLGGLLGTNAGGVNVLRYGNTRNLVLGIEAVLPDGSIYNGLKSLRKDNTGYDLRHLLIGAEGTLGVITAAVLALHPRPAAQGTAVMAVASPRAALDLLAMAQERLGSGISAFELIHRSGSDFLAQTGFSLRLPFDETPEWCVLIELGLPEGLDPEGALEELFAEGFEAELVYDGAVAQSLAQRQAFWEVRETIPEANKRVGAVSSHDISLPLTQVPEFINRAGQALGEIADFRINCFGHLGDGNLHYNLFPAEGRQREDYAAQKGAAVRVVYDLVEELGGSFSAEHGVGRLKVEDLERYGDPAKLAVMRAIKGALDPQGIMNPGAVLRMPEE
ncbi:FAD-binding oxidoreductase [Alphaproteobacteria bacterium KMM 3653]|uniref:FAD-binding oxidoreductase n=1 Tax=Harenicola maris TaxID=2841044 RepID=A0AAP2CQT7_9RHOB|nr:FAD-binding oxidoreductase [Harenicola maris]